MPSPDHLQTKLDALGITPRDWQRIRALILQVTDSCAPPALYDLDAEYAVAAVRAMARFTASQSLGVITRPDGVKVRVVYWRLTDFELGKRGGGFLA